MVEMVGVVWVFEVVRVVRLVEVIGVVEVVYRYEENLGVKGPKLKYERMPPYDHAASGW